MNASIAKADEREPSESGTLSAFSGLAVLCILAAVVFASTFIVSGESAQTQPPFSPPPRAFQGHQAQVPGITFYLLDSEAQLDEIKEIVELAAKEVGQGPLQTYQRVITLLAQTPDEEALAYARIVDDVRSSRGEPLSIEIVDLRAHNPR
jgi:hypothetical protein